MAIFPKIQSPCPYKSQLASVMDGDVCRMCKRQVYDLSDWSDEQRVVFLKGCQTEVCVSYRFRIGPAIAAAAVAAVALGVPAAAAAQDECEEIAELWVGGIKDPANVQYVEDAADSAIPELPVVYEGDQGGQPATDAPASVRTTS